MQRKCLHALAVRYPRYSAGNDIILQIASYMIPLSVYTNMCYCPCEHSPSYATYL